MSSFDPSQLPADIQEMAKTMGVNVEELAARIFGTVPATAAPAAAPTAPAPETAIPGAVPVATAVAENVQVVPTETPLEKAEREKAVLAQELQQTRQNLQTMQDGRVVGNAGLSGPVEARTPTLATIEPGIRWAVRNGLIAAESLTDKLGPTLVELLQKDIGGIV